MKNCVYRFINDNNEIIYIGKAKDLKQRLNSHAHLPKECYEERKRIEYITFDTEDEMDFAERYFILKENPKYNTVLSGKEFCLRSIDLDIKEWSMYSNHKTLKKGNINNGLSLDDIIKELKVLDIKSKTLIDYGLHKNKDTYEFTDAWESIIKEKQELEKYAIRKFKHMYRSEMELCACIRYRVTKSDDIVCAEIQNIKDRYFSICVKHIEEYGYYREDLYEQIDAEFICTYDKTHFHWLHMIKGKFVNYGFEKYAIDVNIKNSLLEEIINDIENRIKCKYGNIQKEIIMLESCNHIDLGFHNHYSHYKFKKFNKPFIVYKVAN